MASLSKLKLDLEKIEGGAWFDHPAGFAMRIRRADFPAYVNAVQASARELRAAQADEKAEIDSAKLTAAVSAAMAEHLVTDWRNVEEPDTDGALQSVGFSVDRLKSYMVDPAFADLYVWVSNCSRQAEQFRAQASAATLGK